MSAVCHDETAVELVKRRHAANSRGGVASTPTSIEGVASTQSNRGGLGTIENGETHKLPEPRSARILLSEVFGHG